MVDARTHTRGAGVSGEHRGSIFAVRSLVASSLVSCVFAGDARWLAEETVGIQRHEFSVRRTARNG